MYLNKCQVTVHWYTMCKRTKCENGRARVRVLEFAAQQKHVPWVVEVAMALRQRAHLASAQKHNQDLISVAEIIETLMITNACYIAATVG